MDEKNINGLDEGTLEPNKRDHKVEITDVAISKVPFIRYREIPEEHYETLQELARMVLEYSRANNDCNETAITYSLDDPEGFTDDAGSLTISYGDGHEVEPFTNAEAFHLMCTASGCVIIVLHNHPSLSKVSLTDVTFLLAHKAVKMVVVVTNRGGINYIVKQDSYNRMNAMKLYKEAAEKNDKANNLKERLEAADYFLNNCYKCGLIFEDH